MTSQPDKASETRELLARCAERVASKKADNGPVSWCASAGDDDGVFGTKAGLFSAAIEHYEQHVVPFCIGALEQPDASIDT